MEEQIYLTFQVNGFKRGWCSLIPGHKASTLVVYPQKFYHAFVVSQSNTVYGVHWYSPLQGMAGSLRSLPEHC